MKRNQELRDQFLSQVWARQSGRDRCIHNDTRKHDIQCARIALNYHDAIQDGIAEQWEYVDRERIEDIKTLIKSGRIGLRGPIGKLP